MVHNTIGSVSYYMHTCSVCCLLPTLQQDYICNAIQVKNNGSLPNISVSPTIPISTSTTTVLNLFSFMTN